MNGRRNGCESSKEFRSERQVNYRHQNRLKDLRNDKDLTQKEVAEIFYLQITQYRRYENGESDLPLEWACKFARFYNVSIDYIAGLTDKREAGERACSVV